MGWWQEQATGIMGTIARKFRIGLTGTAATFDASALTANRTITMPDSDVTLGTALTSQQIATNVLGSDTITGGTVTTSKPLISQAQTWNDGAVAFTGWKLDITNTASDLASRVFKIDVGGSTQFSIGADGAVRTNYFLFNEGSTDGADFFYYGGAGVNLGSTAYLAWFDGAPNVSNIDLRMLRADAGVVGIEDPWAGAGAAIQFAERTAPSAPAANKVVLYAQDNGAGKTQLMARFSSGAAQQVAIQP